MNLIWINLVLHHSLETICYLLSTTHSYKYSHYLVKTYLTQLSPTVVVVLLIFVCLTCCIEAVSSLVALLIPDFYVAISLPHVFSQYWAGEIEYEYEVLICPYYNLWVLWCWLWHVIMDCCIYSCPLCPHHLSSWYSYVICKGTSKYKTMHIMT